MDHKVVSKEKIRKGKDKKTKRKKKKKKKKKSKNVKNKNINYESKKQILEKEKNEEKEEQEKEEQEEEEEGDEVPIPQTTTEIDNKSKLKNNDKQQQQQQHTDKISSIHASSVRSSILTDEKLDNLELDPKTIKSAKESGFEYLTKVQARTIPLLLAGNDLTVAAKTGSGKTLAFLLPAIELLRKAMFAPENGTGVIVISPTRELCLQTYGVLRDMLKYHSQTHGVVMGGASRKEETNKLKNGVNIICATPGRLLDHLQHTKRWHFKNLKCLIMDEADRILETGFEQEMHEILRILPKTGRQTMLFSATMTKNVEDLVRVSMKPDTKFIKVGDEESATVEQLVQGYAVVPSELRFLLLYTFLRKNRKKKLIVFFSACKTVQFYADLLNYVDTPVLSLHGRMKQHKRTNTFFEFVNSTTGALLCTDVAARGLDIPAVDWIIQYDPPDNPKEYIHRVGRTARAGRDGKALIFILPSELTYLKWLKAANVTLNEYEFPRSKIANVQDELEKLVQKNYYLHRSARDAYRAYLAAYASHSHKTIFEVHELDLLGVAKSFGFTDPPKVNLDFNLSSKPTSHKRGSNYSFKKKNKKPRWQTGNSRKFSASNPHGVKREGDNRQFSM